MQKIDKYLDLKFVLNLAGKPTAETIARVLFLRSW